MQIITAVLTRVATTTNSEHHRLLTDVVIASSMPFAGDGIDLPTIRSTHAGVLHVGHVDVNRSASDITVDLQKYAALN